MVLYNRVQTHSNLKLRRYVVKATLKRNYMTIYMGDHLFDGLLKSLNKGLIFKDANVYTQFSVNNDLVNRFYEKYFESESQERVEDLRRFFHGFILNVTHP